MAIQHDDVSMIKSAALDPSGPPPLSAAFLIKFDLKIGYTITWKRSAPGVPLDGSVEFKSLPSGLHGVKEDLVYFVEDQYAGLSAFVNAPAGEEERNAALVAVGILIPLSNGNARLGRGWLHAQRLRDMARILAHDCLRTDILEQFWEEHKAYVEDEAHVTEISNGSLGNTSPKQHSRRRALSNLINVITDDKTLPLFHPALSMMEFVDTFGPLIFPLWRVALLRKRIVLMTAPPVKRACEFVFDISILSNMPSSLSELLSQDTERLQRIRPLFQIGIHDIPLLEREATAIREAMRERPADEGDHTYGPFGFLACTTDEILALKKELYDIMVELPPVSEHVPEQRGWPIIRTADGSVIKATQRDLRRWNLLHSEFTKIRDSVTTYEDGDDDENDSEDPEDDYSRSILQSATSRESSMDDPGYDENLIEPMTWSQLAYSGFMWWASAGEHDTALAEEDEKERHIIGHLVDHVPMKPGITRANSNGKSRSISSSHAGIHAEDAGLHTGIIAYFHRLTGQLVSTLVDIIEDADENTTGESEVDDKEVIHIGTDDIGRMGLDVWSTNSVEFVSDVARMYFGREVVVHGGSVECCGLRVC
ncbi:hypothetical protein EJ05DRAFT_501351 [Pseudovirgaria hyperparasitica]|uniref:DUF4484 domain-containing protein n=1 Tax=Pseudovirgaria hyperparasitica TaxID=470096 RepID=A0A6A6W4A1_9PEZI|nr:uncharacterized protein EJ05DRAFT_501351 [Pseudovirgaria hyperparasitica]KAF2756796.1 hypothetical protein EJ05DRAFT_501351 [Pseudovirgaria hyperparasitica]